MQRRSFKCELYQEIHKRSFISDEEAEKSGGDEKLFFSLSKVSSFAFLFLTPLQFALRGFKHRRKMKNALKREKILKKRAFSRVQLKYHSINFISLLLRLLVGSTEPHFALNLMLFYQRWHTALFTRKHFSKGIIFLLLEALTVKIFSDLDFMMNCNRHRNPYSNLKVAYTRMAFKISSVHMQTLHIQKVFRTSTQRSQVLCFLAVANFPHSPTDKL